jgi:hypothetical protein
MTKRFLLGRLEDLASGIQQLMIERATLIRVEAIEHSRVPSFSHQNYLYV